MSTTEIIVQTEAMERKALSAVEQAKAIVIASDNDLVAADQFYVGLKDIEKEITDTFKEPKERAFQAHRSVVSAERKHLDPITEARRIIKGKICDYQEELARARVEEALRLEAEARKKAEDRALAEAAELEKQGKKEEAQEVIETPIEAPVVILKNDAPKTAAKFRTIYEIEVTDSDALFEFCYRQVGLRKFFVSNETAIRKYVEATQGAMPLPGVKVVRKKV